MFFGLYRTRLASHYDDEGGGSSSSETLLAVDDAPFKLVERWNAKVDADRVEYMAELDAKECPSSVPAEAFEKRIAQSRKNYRDLPKFDVEKPVDLSYSGSTGGGFAGVTYYVTIKPVPQWDA